MTTRPDSFIFRNAQGCAFALIDVSDDAYGCPDADTAWREIYPSTVELVAAHNSGVTVTRQPWDEYNAQGVYDCLGSKCGHVQSEVAA